MIYTDNFSFFFFKGGPSVTREFRDLHSLVALGNINVCHIFSMSHVQAIQTDPERVSLPKRNAVVFFAYFLYWKSIPQIPECLLFIFFLLLTIL